MYFVDIRIYTYFVFYFLRLTLGFNQLNTPTQPIENGKKIIIE